MKWKSCLQRFLIPQGITNLYYMVRFHCLISFKAEIEFSSRIKLGQGVTISSFSKIKATDGVLSVGRKSGFASFCFISASMGKISIGDNCLFGPHVSILSSNYAFDRIDIPIQEQGFTSKGVIIGNNVWVGAGSTILDGTVLGDNTIIVANSLVNRRFPPNVVIQGNPGKVILRRSKDKDEK